MNSLKIDRAYPVRDHRVGLEDGSYQGIIKIGDHIRCLNKSGVIKSITIATDDHDVAGETSGIDVPSYNTKLEYQGSVVFGDNNWCYFNQIINCINDDDTEEAEAEAKRDYIIEQFQDAQGEGY